MRRFRFLIAIPFILLFVSLASFVVMSLWNYLMPHIFHLTEINFWQALAILVLSKLLFGGFGPRGGGPPWARGGRWRARWDEKLANMTPEEREKMKTEWSKRCGPPWMRYRETEPKKEE